MFSAFLRPTYLRFSLFFLSMAGVASAQSKSPAGPLPASFSGWHLESKSVKTTADPAAADPTDAAVLKEYGFTDLETATYTRSGRTMQIKAARFNDATGAFGAFTYYVQPQMQVEKIGDSGASSNSRILFFKSNVLVDVSADHLRAISGVELRALAASTTCPKNDIGKLPTLIANLSSQSLAPNSSHDITGPEALSRLGVPISA